MLRETLLSGIPLGSGIVVGVVGRDGRPLALRAWGLDVAADNLLRVVMGLDDSLAEQLPGRPMAVTSAEVRTFRSHQVKGTVRSVHDATPAELALAAAQTAVFFDAIHEIDGNPIDLLRRLLPARYRTVEMEISEIFEQSPGPNAGSSIGVIA